MEAIRKGINTIRGNLDDTHNRLSRLMSNLTTRAQMAAIATTVVGTLVGASPAQAQTAPTRQSVSTSVPTDKGVAVVTTASNGDEFSKVKSLEEAKALVASGKWTEDDYDNYLDYKDKEDKKEAIEVKTRIEGKKQEAMARNAEEGKIDKEAIIQYRGYIDTFLQLHAVKGQPGFDEKVYNTMRQRLISVITKGDPADVVTIINGNQRLKSILTA